MAGDIDDTDSMTAGQIEMGEAQLDGDAPFLFLFQRSVSIPVRALTRLVVP
jgi:hypothetical protein